MMTEYRGLLFTVDPDVAQDRGVGPALHIIGQSLFIVALQHPSSSGGVTSTWPDAPT
jgi:hypothetical protein